MFPYPSGVGLHVGHPLGFIATDVYARFQRMNGFNVLHAMGYDAFGLPAEQYAVQTGTHPRVTTEAEHRQHAAPAARARARPRSAARSGHHRRRSTTAGRSGSSCRSTTPGTTRTPTARGRSRELVQEFRGRPVRHARRRPVRRARPRSSSASSSTRTGSRTIADAPVNWCPGLGTVLANEEVTADGRSERGNFPVYRRPLKQWMLRITAYADRLLDDLDVLDWTESIKLMQRNWIGRSTGARRCGSRSRATRTSTSRCSRPGPTRCSARPTWCSRPSTRSSTSITAEPVARRRARQRLREQRARRVEGHVRRDRSAAGRGRAATASSRPRSPTSNGRPRPRRRPASSPARSRSTPRTTNASRSSSPTTC